MLCFPDFYLKSSYRCECRKYVKGEGPAAAVSDRKDATHICVFLHPAPTTTPAGAVVGWAGNNSTRQATTM